MTGAKEDTLPADCAARAAVTPMAAVATASGADGTLEGGKEAGQTNGGKALHVRGGA